ncbi:MAG TPA: class I tRNA ligase family protein, partial [Hyphomicrobiales bacterium]|nr:class I tRNA ligase family protein [Hyphomicrobiales bacterium]
DEKGQKMSKSKGNVIDPLELIEEYGADALRFTLVAMAAQGRDIKLSPARVAGYRNFATKLWNAARFCEMNGCVRVEGFDPQAARESLNRWIVVEADRTADAVAEALAAYKFNEAAGALYRFVWNTFCDWYLELAKPALSGEGGPQKDETRATAAFVLDRILVMLHPFMPFITEELWRLTGETGPARAGMLAMVGWPKAAGLDTAAADEINWLVDLITQIRSVRAEMNVPPAVQIPLVVAGAGSETRMRLVTHDAALSRLARLESVTVVEQAPEGAVQIMVGEAIACLPLADIIDISAEKARLAKELDKLAKEVARIDGKLGNEQFIAKAPEEIIEGEREKRDEALARRAKIEEALARLG